MKKLLLIVGLLFSVSASCSQKTDDDNALEIFKMDCHITLFDISTYRLNNLKKVDDKLNNMFETATRRMSTNMIEALKEAKPRLNAIFLYTYNCAQEQAHTKNNR